MKIILILIILLVTGCEADNSDAQTNERPPIMEVPNTNIDSESSDNDEDNYDENYGDDDDEYDDEYDENYDDDDDKYDDEQPSEEDNKDAESTDNNNSTDDSSTQADKSTDTVFNAETLSYYDGREGRPAYVAVAGIVYDLTESSYWRNGSHNGYQAGRDLTNAFPHGDSRLTRFPIVGTYTD